MTIPSELNALIERLDQELNIIEREATEGLNRARLKLGLYPDNTVLIQIFATLNNYVLFGEIVRRRSDYSRLILATDTVTNEQIQEIGEDLSELLGRVLEGKIIVNRAKNQLENWE
ncbi:hypothetical protein [Floridanema evergladense]|uniref:Uncharacterized protein n=1 Tax=Floridaenema evergladense BLCC-F167 TaxID=3153639 RepID=A0ABV4WG52_9CYAN